MIKWYIKYIFLAFFWVISIRSEEDLLRNERGYASENFNYDDIKKFDVTPITEKTKESTSLFRSAISLLSGLRINADDAWDWVLEHFPSAFEGDSTHIYGIVNKYIQSKLSTSNKWLVVRHEAFPDYQIRVQSHFDESNTKLDHVQQHVGYLDFEDKHFFFWFFESRNDPSKDPLIVWLNGGPGCSSMLGLYLILGPSKLSKEENKTYYNPYSWNSKSSIIFLDQPVNVGYSYSNSEVNSNFLAAQDFYAFLSMFLTHFTKYSNLDVHIAGESFAGQYVSIFSSSIMLAQQEIEEEIEEETGETKRLKRTISKDLEVKKINLKSVMIGNGLVDPVIQFPYYYHMGCSGSYGRVLSEDSCKCMRENYPKCHYYMYLCKKLPCACICKYAYEFCMKLLLGKFITEKIDIYDVRLTCTGDCVYDDKPFEAFMNNNSLKKMLNATKQFVACNTSVYSSFHEQGASFESFSPYITDLLEAGIDVLVFVGDADVICNWYGNYAWVRRLQWDGIINFNAKSMKPWTLKRRIGRKPLGTHVGEVKNEGGLTLLRVYNAGHSVGMDQPEANYDMYLRWLKGDRAFS